MAEFNFSLTDGNPDELAKLNKTLNWLMNNLDHDNVTRLYTEYCDIRSEAGETIIDGPLVKMTDGSTTIRLKMGKEGSNFTFSLYNAAGAQTVGIDSLGNAVFTGEITGSVITGGTIQTSTSGAKMVMNSSGLTLYDSTGANRGGFSLVSFLGVDYFANRYNNQFGTNVGTITAYDNVLSIGASYSSDVIDLTANTILLTASTVSISGSLVVDRIKGYTNDYKFYLGSTNCHVNVFDGDFRLVNANGAYLKISDASLTYYDSLGNPTAIV